MGSSYLTEAEDHTLKLAGCSAPFSWINVRNGLRETPVVPDEIFSIVLSFAIRVIPGFPNNLYTTSLCMLVVGVDVLDSDHDRTSQPNIGCLLN
jgi:hypothetical protein